MSDRPAAAGTRKRLERTDAFTERRQVGEAVVLLTLAGAHAFDGMQKQGDVFLVATEAGAAVATLRRCAAQPPTGPRVSGDDVSKRELIAPDNDPGVVLTGHFDWGSANLEAELAEFRARLEDLKRRYGFSTLVQAIEQARDHATVRILPAKPGRPRG